MTSDKLYQPMTEELIKTAHALNNLYKLSKQSKHVEYLHDLYNNQLEELAWEQNKLNDMYAQINKVTIKEV